MKNSKIIYEIRRPDDSVMELTSSFGKALEEVRQMKAGYPSLKSMSDENREYWMREAEKARIIRVETTVEETEIEYDY